MHPSSKAERQRLRKRVIRCAKVWASANGVKAVYNAESCLLKAVADLRSHERKYGSDV